MYSRLKILVRGVNRELESGSFTFSLVRPGNESALTADWEAGENEKVRAAVSGRGTSKVSRRAASGARFAAKSGL